ncbi:MAG TPA: V-type ATPase subunit [Candidatus Nanoarchaeia archaeon]|nr:V-type ATPase subunit [Candidatus Nanoarchaeia archaeon]
MRLKENPYAYVRTRVMKTLLLKRADYDKILKMEAAEIARFLSEMAYKKEIDELASRISGIDLLESALNANLSNTMAKLKRMSDEDLKKVINIYLKRWDYENVKILVRGISTKANKDYTSNLLIPLGELDRKSLGEMSKLNEAAEVLRKSELFSSSDIKKLLEMHEANPSALENELDQRYYNEVLEFASQLESTLFKDFLNSEVEMKNIIALVRLKRNNVEKKAINDALIKFGKKVVLPMPEKLIGAKGVEEIFELLKKTNYAKIADYSLKKMKETNSLIEFENAMKRKLLEKTTLLSHQYPLSVDVILGYMFAKELEASNLKTIIRGKNLNLENEFLSRQVVVA